MATTDEGAAVSRFRWGLRLVLIGVAGAGWGALTSLAVNGLAGAVLALVGGLVFGCLSVLMLKARDALLHDRRTS